ncbi:Glypican-1, partial [Camelus dromedarius]
EPEVLPWAASADQRPRNIPPETHAQGPRAASCCRSLVAVALLLTALAFAVRSGNVPLWTAITGGLAMERRVARFFRVPSQHSTDLLGSWGRTPPAERRGVAADTPRFRVPLREGGSAAAARGRFGDAVMYRQWWRGLGPSPLPTGEHLRICPQGYTCCTSEMEENLANRSRAELEAALLDSGRALQTTLATQLRGFDGPSGTCTHELRSTIPRASLHLEESLAEFWARLLERLFRQLHPQLLLPDDYLDCLGKQAEALRPFGEAPRELRLRAARAFVAARSFVQGLGVAGDVVRKVAQVPLGLECSRAVMKLVYCAHCLGVPGARPCPDYCRNVLKGCLANQADLDAEWRNLLDSMVLITDKFWGPAGAESIMGSVHLWLAEAISALQDNRDTLTAKVIQGCGNPKVNPQGSGPEERRRRGKLALPEKPPTGVLEKLVSEAKAQLRDAQDFWISLPGTLCSEKLATSTASDDRCWNGMAKGRYLPEVMGDGLANQINNPEVEVDITKPDMTIRQQIMQLKIMTNRLRSAYNGNDVDFQDASDDGSGSGSGDGCPDDICGRRVGKKNSSSRTTLTHALPGLSEQEGQKTSAAGCPQPCPSLLLLPALTLLLSAARPRWR